MRIVPVMDLLDGTVVHAVGGEREKYEPVDSVLTNTADPLKIASKFEEIGFKDTYIADLNAIQEVGENLDVVERLASETDLDLIVDAGFKSSDEVAPYKERDIYRAVLATETLESFEEVRRTVEEHSLPVTGSIDVKEGEVLTKFLGELTVTESVRKFEEAGVGDLILLNLKRVGSSGGPDLELLTRVIEAADVPILTGGGIRDTEDLERLKKRGAAGALVATALHSGSIELNQVG